MFLLAKMYFVPVVGQKEDVEQEILRNIDVEVLDALSPQPSIVSVLTHGLEQVRTPVNSIAARGFVMPFFSDDLKPV